MYNKYFTMKRSELKEAIKNEITSVLSEGMSDKERENQIQHLMRTGAKEKPLRKLAAIGKKEDENEKLREGTWSLGKASDINMILSQLQDLSKKAYNIIGDDEFYNGIDAAITRAEELMMNAPLNQAKSAADVNKEVKDLESKMKDKAKDFKAAEGKAKDKIKDELKDMTTKRNDLKKKVEDLKKKEEEKIANKGKDQELDT